MKFILIIILLSITATYSQTKNNTMYIMYDNMMRTSHVENDIIGIRVNLSFSITNNDKDRITTYNFIVDNLRKDFTELRFNKLKDTLLESIDLKKVNTLKSLQELGACEQYLTLADTKPITLIRDMGSYFLKYNLTYWSTQRGWVFSDN